MFLSVVWLMKPKVCIHIIQSGLLQSLSCDAASARLCWLQLGHNIHSICEIKFDDNDL